MKYMQYISCSLCIRSNKLHKIELYIKTIFVQEFIYKKSANGNKSYFLVSDGTDFLR